MDGSPWKAGKFSFSLRLSLWTEHLGLSTEEVIFIYIIKDNVFKSIYLEFCLFKTVKGLTCMITWLVIDFNCIYSEPYIF